jgi:hypothetical protein
MSSPTPGKFDVMAIWARTPDVTLGDLLARIDLQIMMEIANDPIGDIQRMYTFFDSEEKPLKLREFLKFCESLTPEEDDYFCKEIFKIYPPTEMRGIRSLVDDGEVKEKPLTPEIVIGYNFEAEENKT